MNAMLLPKWDFASLFMKRSFYEIIAPIQSLPLFPMLIIYMSMLLDNILRSIIVPLLPDLLTLEEHGSNAAKTEKSAVLLASKTIIQLAANSFVAVFVQKVGCQSALLAGNIVLLITSLLFGFGNTFFYLLMARGLQGIASTVITVSGMSICAEKFTDDEKVRNKFMGFMIGSDAAGVLCAYTVGILAFNVCGKLILFLLIAIIILVNASLLLIQVNTNDLKKNHSTVSLTTASSNWYHLMENLTIVLISAALFLSSSTIAILEPCLPIWIKENIFLEVGAVNNFCLEIFIIYVVLYIQNRPKPEGADSEIIRIKISLKWQSGLIFLPDSLGYLISTSVSPLISHRVGKWRIVMLAALLIGACSILIPSASTLLQLSLPHFCIGFGIGAVDSTVMPMLADFADMKKNTHYSSVYALEQGITSLAYVCGYIFTAELIRIIGFPLLILGIGTFNVVYGIIVFFGEFTFLKENNMLWRKSDDIQPGIELICTKHFAYSTIQNVYDDD